MATKDQEELAQKLLDHIAVGHFHVGSPAYFLAKQVADEGMGSLLPHQRSAWDTLIKPILDASPDELRKIEEAHARARAGH
ncbi:hypothetical protein [Phreatobacter stygius]|uniref:Uncharacterized protein n=1 Tax=Phreatobacter stygius TaxID=1940610 RepID=A0A4D7B8G5_9HYPH|nr:hypothetical protein [Phreatobacter stygius]QCI64392.1 hypothetical protein E8M01_09205 [Phreatobacter stygius]